MVGTNSAYPPYESIGQNGEIEGFDIDIAKEIAQRMGRKLVLKDMAFDALILALHQGQVDLVLAGMSITPSRQKEIDMIPYQGEPIRSYTLLFSTAVPPNIHGFSDLSKLSGPIAVQIGNHMEHFLRQMEGLDIKALEATTEIVMDVEHDKSAVGVFETHIAREVLQKNPNLKPLELPLPKTNWVLGSGIGVKKGNSQLLKEVNQIVNDLRSSKRIQQLEAKWFHKQNP